MTVAHGAATLPKIQARASARAFVWRARRIAPDPLLFYGRIGFVVLRTSLTPHLQLYYWPRQA
jgi:hypothetical protein